MANQPRSTVMQRFRQDRGGNVMVIMAASVFPMVAAVGGAIDISRLYAAQSRLQQACDAGVLAGRKKQAGQPFANSGAASEANEYFRINYSDGTYDSNNVQFSTSARNNNEVTGQASAFVPATVSKFFGFDGKQLTVNCSAKFDLSNTDVMFVLDVTGSMNCPSDSSVACPGGGSNGGREYGNESGSNPLNTTSRIGALRRAVKDFHAILEGAKPTGIQFRYGYVPYSSSVNVGALLRARDANMIANSATIHSRENYVDTYYGPYNPGNYGTSNGCRATGTNYEGKCYYRGSWLHQAKTYDVSQFKMGTGVPAPTEEGSPTSVWAGCIMERSTVSATSFSPVPAAATDLDVDSVPTNNATRWVPLWPEVAYRRYTTAASARYLAVDSDPLAVGGACPVASDLVQTRSANAVDTFVKSLQADGGTYHDVGMIWGIRLLSPNGIWQSHNASTTNNLPITRHIIFMTDGLMAPRATINSAYGLERHENRVAGGALDDDTLEARHNARFLAMCDIAKGKGIRVWTVAFGTSLSDTKLVDCADSGRAFEARNAPELNDTFQRIATRIADLRLDQ